jgi:hypothetical protein
MTAEGYYELASPPEAFLKLCAYMNDLHVHWLYVCVVDLKRLKQHVGKSEFVLFGYKQMLYLSSVSSINLTSTLTRWTTTK